MRYSWAIVLLFATGLLMGAGPLPKVGEPRLTTGVTVGTYPTKWADTEQVVFAPDGSSLTITARSSFDAKVAYAYICRFEGGSPLKVDGVIPFSLVDVLPLAYSPDSSKVAITGVQSKPGAGPISLVQTYDIKKGHRLGARGFDQLTPYYGAMFLPDNQQMIITTSGSGVDNFVLFQVKADSENLSGGRLVTGTKSRSLVSPGQLLFSRDGRVMVEFGEAWPGMADYKMRDEWIRFRDAKSAKVFGRIVHHDSDNPAWPVGKWVTGKDAYIGQFIPQDLRVGDDKRSVMGITIKDALAPQVRAPGDRRPPSTRVSRFGDRPDGTATGARATNRDDRALTTIDITQLDIAGNWRTIRLDHGHPDATAWAGMGQFSEDGSLAGYLMRDNKDQTKPYRINIHEVKSGKRLAALDIVREESKYLSAFTILSNGKVRLAWKTRVKDEGDADVKDAEDDKLDSTNPSPNDGKDEVKAKPNPPAPVTPVKKTRDVVTVIVEDYEFRKQPR